MSKGEEIIVLRRAEDTVEAKKGGVWKIAHADFMTAMMAFFLIMWLVNATDEEIKKSIANYFNPINLVVSPTDQKGITDPKDDEEPPASGHEEGKRAGDNPMGAEAPGPEGRAVGGGNVEVGNERTMASAGLLAETDNAAFNDPFATLASAAADIDPQDPTSVDVPQSTLGVEGTTTNTEDVRDPFDPAYWQTTPARPAQTLRPGRSDTADVRPPNAPLDATTARPRGNTVNPQDNSVTGTAPAAPRTAPRSAVAEQILAQQASEERTSAASEPANGTGDTSDAAAARAQAAREDIEAALEGASAEVSVTAGEKTVLIALTDDAQISMFAIGSSAPTTEAVDLFARVGSVLAQREGLIVVRGHTDARPFRGGTSDNWTLSFARAHATKNALVDSGVAERRFVRVEGLADRQPAVPSDPLADENRRIEILYQPGEEDQ